MARVEYIESVWFKEPITNEGKDRVGKIIEQYGGDIIHAEVVEESDSTFVEYRFGIDYDEVRRQDPRHQQPVELHKAVEADGGVEAALMEMPVKQVKVNNIQL